MGYDSGNNPLTKCDAPRGRATILNLDWVDRVDAPGGSSNGPPGREAAHYVRATPLAEVAFEELYKAGSPFVLYSIEQASAASPYFVFLSLSPEARRKLWLEEAFIDRGIRRVVELGARVAVASLETASDHARDALASLESGEWRLSFIWNTGRCGSTLMHRVVSAMGGTSFSEPHWLDQLVFNPLGEERMRRAVRVCVALEALTARLQEDVPGWKRPTNFVFNPKSGGIPLAEATVGAFPLARHVFMYRACHKVVDSFTGLKAAGGGVSATIVGIAWKLLGPHALRLFGKPAPADPSLSALSSPPVAMATAKWIGVVRSWIGATERRAAALGADDPLASAIVLRMDEFVSKDLALRAKVVRTVLVHLRIIGSEASDACLEPALGAFSVHSQAGSAMSGPKAKIVTDNDVDVIKRCVVDEFSEQAIVENNGANIVLPRSLGTTS